MLLKRRAIMLQHSSAPQRRLPYEYQELAYIESTGTQYINTGVIGGFSIEMKCQLTDLTGITNNNFAAFYGSQNGSSPWQGTFCRVGIDYYYFSVLSTGQETYARNTDVNVIVADCYDNFKSVTMNGVTKSSTITASYNIYEMYLFALNSGGQAAQMAGTKKIYYANIYSDKEKTTAVRKLIPAMRYSDKVAGLYDTVNDVFYTNQGTGEFKMGPWVPYRLPEDFQEVEWIGASGTQYIDTGINLNATTDATEIDYMSLKAEGVSFQVPIGSSNASNGANAYHFYIGGTNNISVRNGKGDVTSINTLWGNGERHVAKITHDGFYLDNSFYPITSENINQNYSCFVLARNTAGTAAAQCTGRVYRATIYRNGIENRNLIPCYRISDGVIGMYDTVSNTFKTNSGTGTFTKGPNLPKRLPDEYQEVSYIGTSDATSKTHIDTGVVLQSVFTINAKVLWHQVLTTGAYQYHGHFNSGSSVQFGAQSTATHYISSTTGAKALSSEIAVAANTIYNIQLKADGMTSTFTVNETTVTGNYTFSAINSYTSFIFGRNGNETYLGSWVNGKVYSYDISKDNVLIRYYVPCYRKADNVIGLYDLCGSVCSLTGTSFYTNAGSGTFTKGADV